MTPPSAGGVAGVLDLLRAMADDAEIVQSCELDGLAVMERRREAIRTVEAMAGALEQIKKLPSKPFPDPGAHSWEAFARAVMGAFTDARMDAVRALAAIESAAPAGDGTPSSRWAANGEPDPHGKQYDCERAALAMGDLTDDELANAVFLRASSAYLTAAKDRIRWLSRRLVEATTPAALKGGEDRMAIKLLVAAGFVTEDKANEALNIAHGFAPGPLPATPAGGGGELPELPPLPMCWTGSPVSVTWAEDGEVTTREVWSESQVRKYANDHGDACFAAGIECGRLASGGSAVGEVRIQDGCIVSTSIRRPLPDGGYDVVPQTASGGSARLNRLRRMGRACLSLTRAQL